MSEKEEEKTRVVLIVLAKEGSRKGAKAAKGALREMAQTTIKTQTRELF